MPKLVSKTTCDTDNWTVIAADAVPANASDVAEYSLLPLDNYLALAGDLGENIGVWLSSDEDVLRLEPQLSKLAVIACHFNAFADGRSFSQARILRDRLAFDGDIRALGHFIQDQLFYLQRCGFSSFSVDDDADIDSMRTSLADFSDSYQAACDTPTPLFRRRA